MTLRSGRLGPFYGCVEFPRCRGLHPADERGRPIRTRVPSSALKAARGTLTTELDRLAAEVAGAGLTKPQAAAAVRMWTTSSAGFRVDVERADFDVCYRLVLAARKANDTVIRETFLRRRAAQLDGGRERP